MYACWHVCQCVGTCRGQKRGPYTLNLELEVVTSLWIWGWGTELWPSGRADVTYNVCGISLVSIEESSTHVEKKSVPEENQRTKRCLFAIILLDDENVDYEDMVFNRKYSIICFLLKWHLFTHFTYKLQRNNLIENILKERKKKHSGFPNLYR